MKSLILAACASTLALAAGPVLAQSITDQMYGSLGYSNVDVGPKLDVVTGRVGWDSQRILGIEGEASIGVGADRTGTGATSLSAREKYDAAIYGVARAPLGDDFSVLGRLGYGVQEVTTTTGAGVKTAYVDDSINYGAGVQYNIAGGPNGVRADYTRRDFSNASALKDANVWSLSFNRKF